VLVSPEFNRLYHGAFLGDIYKQMLSQKRIIISFEKFKEALKYANESYPRYDNSTDLVSTRDIRNKDLVLHIEWIIKWAGEYGITPGIVQEQWSRLLELTHA
jgi:hypothetical protein